MPSVWILLETKTLLKPLNTTGKYSSTSHCSPGKRHPLSSRSVGNCSHLQECHPTAIEYSYKLHPWKVTCPLLRDYFKNRKYIFQPSIFRGHLSDFRGSTCQNPSLTTSKPSNVCHHTNLHFANHVWLWPIKQHTLPMYSYNLHPSWWLNQHIWKILVN